MHFNGTDSQIITDTNVNPFNNLTVNKPAGDLIIGNPLTVKSTLTMTSGNIITGGFTLTLGQTAEGSLVHISGTIIGSFERYISSTVTHQFPVGTVSYTRTVEIVHTSPLRPPVR